MSIACGCGVNLDASPAAAPSTHRDIAVVGASAGGVQALRQLAQGLPADYPGTLFVVLHMGPDSPGLMDKLLSSAGPLPARAAVDGAPYGPGEIWVAQPDRHLVLERGRMRVTPGPPIRRAGQEK